MDDKEFGDRAGRWARQLEQALAGKEAAERRIAELEGKCDDLACDIEGYRFRETDMIRERDAAVGKLADMAGAAQLCIDRIEQNIKDNMRNGSFDEEFLRSEFPGEHEVWATLRTALSTTGQEAAAGRKATDTARARSTR